MIRIEEIEKERVDSVFDDIYQWVVSSLGSDRTYTANDIKSECEKGLWNLRLIYDNNRLTGFFVSTVVLLPRGKLLYGAWLGGENLQDWVRQGFCEIADWARKNGCIAYSFIGRSAWKKLIDCDYNGVYYYINL